MTTHRATFYAQVQATFHRYYKDQVESTKVIAITQNKPGRMPANTVAIELTLEIPDDAFKPFSPSAVVTVPASQVTQPIHVITGI